MTRTAFIAAATLTLAAAACADEMPRDVQQATSPPSSPDAVHADTIVDEFAREPDQLPPGGYADWIEDVRRELPRVLDEAQADRGNALDQLRHLYLARLEPLRTHFGEGGSSAAIAGMAAAITRADAQFQTLMRNLADAETSAATLRDAANALIGSLDEVLAEGTAAGLPPDAPRS